MALIYSLYALLVLALGILCLGLGLWTLRNFHYRPKSSYIGLIQISNGAVAITFSIAMFSPSDESFLFSTKLAYSLMCYCPSIMFLAVRSYRGYAYNELRFRGQPTAEARFVRLLLFISTLFVLCIWLRPELFFADFQQIHFGFVSIEQVSIQTASLFLTIYVLFCVSNVGGFMIRFFDIDAKLTVQQIFLRNLSIFVFYAMSAPFTAFIGSYPVPNLAALTLPLAALLNFDTFVRKKPDLKLDYAVEINPTAWHDLRNLTSALNDRMYILREQVEVNEKIKVQLLQIEQVVSELQAYMNQVNLPLSKEVPPIAKEDVLVNSVVQDTYQFWQSIGQKKQLDMQNRIATEATILTLDPTWFKRTLDNLLHNAIKFTPSHGQIIVETLISNEKYILRVSDTGIGIPESDQAHIFEKNYRGRNARAFKGEGLGLTSVADFAREHDAALDIQSTLGQGTSIQLILPLD